MKTVFEKAREFMYRMPDLLIWQDSNIILKMERRKQW